jgi:periplasmic copper chaperone A
MRTTRVARLTAAFLTGLAAAATAGVGAASAHVTVNPRDATQGGYAKLAFRVPNEKDDASTVKLEVTLPADAPIASVSVKPVPGWTAVVEKAQLATPLKVHDTALTEAPAKITWTATGADTAVKPGQFQEFEISAGPLPAVDRIVFKALQTYSDGDIVRWIEEPGADGTEPAHPAPVLKLTDAAPASGSAPTAGDPAAGDQPGATVTATRDTSDARAGWALALSIAALIAGLTGLVVSLAGRSRRGTFTAT